MDKVTQLNTKKDIKEYIVNNKINLKEYKAIGYYDIDEFIRYNDKYGHVYGDKQLERISKILKDNFEPDTCLRWAGDEFLILLKNDKENINKLKYVKELIDDKNINYEKSESKIKYFKISFVYIDNVIIENYEDLENIAKKALVKMRETS